MVQGSGWFQPGEQTMGRGQEEAFEKGKSDSSDEQVRSSLYRAGRCRVWGAAVQSRIPKLYNSCFCGMPLKPGKQQLYRNSAYSRENMTMGNHWTVRISWTTVWQPQGSRLSDWWHRISKGTTLMKQRKSCSTKPPFRKCHVKTAMLEQTERSWKVPMGGLWR